MKSSGETREEAKKRHWVQNAEFYVKRVSHVKTGSVMREEGVTFTEQAAGTKV